MEAPINKAEAVCHGVECITLELFAQLIRIKLANKRCRAFEFSLAERIGRWTLRAQRRTSGPAARVE